MALLDHDLNVVRVNEAMSQRLGLSRDECVGKRCFALTFGALSGPDDPLFSTMREGGHSFETDITVSSLGAVFKIRISAYNDGGADQRYVEVVQDITDKHRTEQALQLAYELLEERVRERTEELTSANQELVREVADRQRAELALRQSEERLRHVVQNMPVLFAAFDTDHAVRAWNRACEIVTGYDAEEIEGRADVWQLLCPDAEVRSRLLEQVHHDHGDYSHLEMEIINKQGERKTISWSSISQLVPIPGWASWIIGIDISRRKQAEQERGRLQARVLQAQKLESLGVMAGGIAHDFNNLLMGILGNAEMISMACAHDPEVATCVDEITCSAKRATKLTAQLLAYAGAGAMSMESLDLSQVVRDTRQALEALADDVVTVSFELEDQLPPIKADDLHVRQVLMSLVENAVESCPSGGGTITVSTRTMGCTDAMLQASYVDDRLPQGRYVCLEVADNGEGIDPTAVKRVCEPFFTTKIDPGRGLGLASALGIIRSHHGALTIHSEMGRGTTIRVLLPELEESQARKRGKPATKGQLHEGAHAVLLVDDEVTVRAVTTSMLGRLGYQVFTAGDGVEALEVYRKHKGQIVLVLLDLKMPRRGGEEVFGQLRAMQDNLKIILCSGYDEQVATRAFVGEELDGFLQKPYSFTELRDLVMSVIGDTTNVDAPPPEPDG